MNGLDYVILVSLSILTASVFVLLVYLATSRLFNDVKNFLAKLWMSLKR